jgi:hypothetical protein
VSGQVPSDRKGLTIDATTRAQIPRHPGDMDLSFEQVCDRLSALEGRRVHVRVAERSEPEMLLATFEGPLGSLSSEKHPALFWPVGGPESRAACEEPGFAPAAKDRRARSPRGPAHQGERVVTHGTETQLARVRPWERAEEIAQHIRAAIAARN